MKAVRAHDYGSLWSLDTHKVHITVHTYAKGLWIKDFGHITENVEILGKKHNNFVPTDLYWSCEVLVGLRLVIGYYTNICKI